MPTRASPDGKLERDVALAPRRAVLLLAAIALTAFNLRPLVTSVGALLRPLQAGTGMSDGLAGALTSLPMVAFGVVGLSGAGFTRRLGLSRTFVVALLAMSVGMVARVWTAHPLAVMTATGVAVVGVALANIVLPVAVRKWFPDRLGAATALYTVGLQVGAGVAAVATVPIAQAAGGWRAGLGAWAAPVVVTLMLWWLIVRRTTPASEVLAKPVAGDRSIRRDGKAWAVAVFFGTQSLAAYTAMGWLPTIYQDAGVSPTAAGVYLSLVMAVGIPAAIGLPVIAARRADQRLVVVVLAGLTATAYVGLLVAPAALPALWAVLLGIGFGAFPLALTLIAMRAGSDVAASQLSSLAQGVGYLIAASGPVSIGLIHDATGGWYWPLIALFMALGVQLVAGLYAAAPGSIGLPPSEASEREGLDTSVASGPGNPTC